MDERQLFDFIKTNYIPDLQRTDPFDYKDGFSREYNLHIELKCRNKHYDKLLIEQIKYIKLLAHPNVRYVNWTPDGIFIFDLHDMSRPDWQVMDMPASSEFENREQVKKCVAFLDINEAIKIEIK